MKRKSKIVTSESLVLKHKAKGVSVISLITFLFLNNLLPEYYWSFFEIKYMPDFLQKMSCSIVISTLITLIFYNSDPLFKGDNNISKWLRSLFASNLLIQKYKMNIHEANSLWFKYYNQWQHRDHPNHSFLKKSHSSSYSARLVYFISIICFVYGSIAILTYIYSLLEGGDISLLFLALVYLSIGGILYFLNLPPKYSGEQLLKPAKGVWLSVENSFSESRSRFNAEVVSKCDTAKEAEDLVEKTSQKWVG